jgi:hypothetical protein
MKEPTGIFLDMDPGNPGRDWFTFHMKGYRAIDAQWQVVL